MISVHMRYSVNTLSQQLTRSMRLGDKSAFITTETWSSIHAEIFNRSIDADSSPFWQLIKRSLLAVLTADSL